MSAIAPASNEDSTGIEIRSRTNPIQKRPNILVGVGSQKPIIELQKRLAVARGAANVGKNHRHTELVQEIIVTAEEGRTKLSFRTAVNVDYNGPLPLESYRRSVQKSGDHF